MCIVCGRKFPDGQGIVVKIEDREIAFHSSKCAAKFYKMLVDRGSKEVISESLKLAKELENVLNKRMESMSKKI